VEKFAKEVEVPGVSKEPLNQSVVSIQLAKNELHTETNHYREGDVKNGQER
jgi:hypothetical protein